jgi:glycosyltransferase involved in cell wall biosynthesis
VPAIQTTRPQLQISLELDDRARSEELAESCRTFLESQGRPFHLSVYQPPEPRISVVIPALNEEATLPALYRRLTGVLTRLQVSYELIVVDDGSTDRTPDLLCQLHGVDPRVKYVRLARNFGHQAALTAGLARASGQAVVVMDADLQDPPEVIPELVERWEQGYEVVYAVRRHRK